MNIPVTNRPKAYSYVRFSTPEQEKGDSLRRQMQLATDYAARHGLELVDASYQDLGVSAFRGANAETGMLGEFIEAVRAGAVPRNAWLLIEGMDRLSRAKPLKAMNLLQRICGEGITVVTLADQKVYNEQTLEDDPWVFMMAYLVAIRANEESATKARRLKAAWSSKRATATERVLTARAPTWLRLEGAKVNRKFVVIEEKAAVVRRIFDMTIKNVGQHKIAETLNMEHVPTFDRGKMWHRSFIAKLLASEAVIGTYTPHTIEVDTKGKKIRKPAQKVMGYYPQIVDPEVFHEVQTLLSLKAARGRHVGRGTVRNVLAGLARCPICEGAATLVSKNNKDRYIVCSKAKAGAGCEYKAVNYVKFIEPAILMNAQEWMTTQLYFEGNTDAHVSALNAVDRANATVKYLLDAISAGGPSIALTGRLREAEAALETAQKELVQIEETLDATSAPLVEARLERLSAALSKGDVGEINRAMRPLMQGVTVDHRKGELVFHWWHGVETTAMYTFPEP
ncbi:MAG: recombinase family protein [Rhizobiales bacterium]|nr:recombinase family protein [Hyphomicrobiales bacterium]